MGPQDERIRFRGSRLARTLLRLAGWHVRFDGLPGAQGVIVVYPHTSNWDFIVGILAKWTLRLPVRFWAKDSLFRIPLFGDWLQRRGGVPVVRGAAQGTVTDMVARLQAAREHGDVFWLALAPEGTRRFVPGWRSGFYQLVLQAGVPLGLATLDWGRREVRLTDFLRLDGEPEADLARIAQAFESVRGFRHEHAAPVRLLRPGGPTPSDTIVR